MPTAALIPCAAGLLALHVHAAPPARSDAGAEEPTITRREADLLREAAQVGTTNAAAAATLLKQVDAGKSSAAIDFALGNLRFQEHDFDSAAAAYRRALDKHPTFTRAAMNLARVHLMQDRPDPAITLFSGIVLRGRANEDTYLLMGHALLLKERAVSAENAYRQALLLSPESRDARLGLTRCLLNQHRYPETLGLAAELLAADANSSELWSLRASALIALDRTGEAMRILESARRLGRATGEMTATLGDLYLNADMPGEAVTCHREAARENAVSPAHTLRAAGALLALQHLDEAEALLPSIEKGVADGDETGRLQSELWRLKAQLAHRQGRADEAVRLCRELVRRDPLDGKTFLLLGDLHRERDELENALMSYERAAGTEGSEAEALVRQAQIEVERERYARAVELLEASLVFGDAPHVARYLEQVRRLVR